MSAVTIIECPRDAWQAVPQQIPSEVKAEYLGALVQAGFKHIDAVSFVSPAAVPQMADAETVLALLQPPPDVEIIAIVLNQQGAERAAHTGAVSTLGFPYSISATFLARNQRQTPKQSLEILRRIGADASKEGLGVAVYLSMAFGNPYGDPWRQEDVVTACRSLEDLGIVDISLADTVGLAGPDQILSLLSAVAAELPGIRIGAHLHARPEEAAAKIAAAYQAGCRRLDMAVGGQGGCPFAQDALVGNVATEIAVSTLTHLGALLPSLRPLDALLTMSRTIADKYGTPT